MEGMCGRNSLGKGRSAPPRSLCCCTMPVPKLKLQWLPTIPFIVVTRASISSARYARRAVAEHDSQHISCGRFCHGWPPVCLQLWYVNLGSFFGHIRPKVLPFDNCSAIPLQITTQNYDKKRSEIGITDKYFTSHVAPTDPGITTNQQC